MTAFVFGLLFGMATALPVGVQSFVVMNQGLRFGYPRVMVGIVTASLCDSFGFACGAIAASWLWFVVIGFGASALRSWLTAPVRLWTQCGSGALMLVFAGFPTMRLA